MPGSRVSFSIPVRIGSQSRVFALSPSGRMKALDDRVIRDREDFNIMTVEYRPACVRTYHRHEIGRAWIPTAPSKVSGSGTIEVSPLTMDDFVSHLPHISLGNHFSRRWFPEKAELSGFTTHGSLLHLNVVQHPSIEGIDSFVIKTSIASPLTFLDGNAVLEVAITNHFGFERRLRIYHDGHSDARIGILHSGRFDSVSCIAYDGARVRFLYRTERSGAQSATMYLINPNGLYSLTHQPRDAVSMSLVKELKPDFALGVRPLRNFEWMMLDHGSAYDHGMVGAEIAHTICTQMLLTNQLLMFDPAKHGSDLVSKDKSVAIEARMLATSKPKTGSYIKEIALPYLRQMTRRLVWQRSRGSIKRGIAVISLRVDKKVILALVKEV